MKAKLVKKSLNESYDEVTNGVKTLEDIEKKYYELQQKLLPVLDDFHLASQIYEDMLREDEGGDQYADLQQEFNEEIEKVLFKLQKGVW